MLGYAHGIQGISRAEANVRLERFHRAIGAPAGPIGLVNTPHGFKLPDLSPPRFTLTPGSANFVTTGQRGRMEAPRPHHQGIFRRFLEAPNHRIAEGAGIILHTAADQLRQMAPDLAALGPEFAPLGALEGVGARVANRLAVKAISARATYTLARDPEARQLVTTILRDPDMRRSLVRAAPYLALHAGRRGTMLGVKGLAVAPLGVGATTGHIQAALEGRGQFAAILPKGGGTVLHNALDNLLNLPANAIPSVYLPLAALTHDVAHPNAHSQLGDLWAQFKKHDPLGTLSQGDFAGFVAAVKANPLLVGLELGGVHSVIGRGLGATGRALTTQQGRETGIFRAGLGKREPIPLTGGGEYARVRSPNVLTALVQDLRDRFNPPRRAPIPSRAHPGYGRARQLLSRSGRKSRRFVDFQWGTNRTWTANERASITAIEKRLNILAPKHLHDGVAPVLARVIEGVITKRDFIPNLDREITRVEALKEGLDPRQREFADSALAALEEVRAHPEKYKDKLFQGAELYARVWNPIEQASIERGWLTSEQALRAGAKQALLAHGEGRFGIRTLAQARAEFRDRGVNPEDVGGLGPLGIVENVPRETPPARPTYYHGSQRPHETLPPARAVEGVSATPTISLAHTAEHAAIYGPHVQELQLAPGTKVLDLTETRGTVEEKIAITRARGAQGFMHQNGVHGGNTWTTIIDPNAVQHPIAELHPGIELRSVKTEEIPGLLRSYGVEGGKPYGFLSHFESTGSMGAAKAGARPSKPVTKERTGQSGLAGAEPASLSDILANPERRIAALGTFDTLSEIVRHLARTEEPFRTARAALNSVSSKSGLIPYNLDVLAPALKIERALERGEADAWDPEALSTLTEPDKALDLGKHDPANPDTVGKWVLIDEKLLARSLKHAAGPAGLEPFQKLQTMWKRVILTTTPTWYSGNFFNVGLIGLMNRLAPPVVAAGTVKAGLGMGGRGRDIVEALGPRGRAALVPGGVAGTTEHGGAQVESVPQQFADFVRTAKEFRRNPLRLGRRLFSQGEDLMLSINQRLIEEPIFEQMVGRVATQQMRLSMNLWQRARGVQTEAVMDFAQGLHGTPNQLAFADLVNKQTGNWAFMAPGESFVKANFAPFYLWHRAATRFVLLTIPHDHPLIAAGVATAESTTQEHRQLLGLDLYGPLDKTKPWLAGGLPAADGKIRPVSTQTAFGLFSDYPTSIANSIFPMAGGFIAALQGTSWNGTDFAAHGETLKGSDRMALAAWVFAESFIPFGALGNKVLSQGRATVVPGWYRGPKQFSKGRALKYGLIPLSRTYEPKSAPRRKKSSAAGGGSAAGSQAGGGKQAGS